MNQRYLWVYPSFAPRLGRWWAPMACLAALLLFAGSAWGQRLQGEQAPDVTPPTVTPSGETGRDLAEIIRHSATGLALPNEVVEADLELQAGRVRAWKVGEQHRMLLERDVRVAVGAYNFRAERVVAIVTPQQRPGRRVHEVALYLDEMREIGGGAIRAEAPRLLVTAVIEGTVRLETDALSRESADDHELVAAARQRLAHHRQAIAANTAPVPAGEPLLDEQTLAQREQRREALRAARPDLPPGFAERLRARPLLPDPTDLEATLERPDLLPQPRASIPSPASGQVDFHADRIVYRSGEDEGQVLLMGNIQVMYVDPETDLRLNLVADNAVIFTEPDALALDGGRSSDAGAIRGIYLEDNVRLTDGDYTLRGPRVFYDFRTEQAVVLEAVMFTWDVERQVPLYVRADSLRQHSRNQWSATNAQLSTSEFAVPHFGIGVDRLTVTAEQQADSTTRHTYNAEGLSLNVGETPVFYLPGATGAAADTPLQRVNAGAGSRRGAFVRTQWDLFSLLNVDDPAGVEASLLVDGYTERGPAVGLSAEYDVEDAFGELETYYLYDHGEDKPGGRQRVDPLTHHRNRTLWRHRHDLGDNWEATAEAAWLSDPTFLDEFFRQDAYADKEYETVFYLKHQENNAAFTFLGKYDLLDFVPQSNLLQGRGNFAGPDVGYTTNKYPELAYHRIAESLFGDRLTWYSENRASVMELNLPTDRPAERGFTDAEAVAFFGMANANQRFNTPLLAAGFDDERRYRGDTRQELQAPLTIGPLNVTPYVTGRVTAYDDDFAEYRGEDDNLRLWGALGVKAHTSFSRSYNNVENALLDVNRLRHVVEPSVNLFFADTTIEQRDLPVYDYDVESLADGAVAQFGVRNTFQTQRGGPGNWRSVDMLRIDTQFVFADNDVDRESPIGRFYDYRPEHSLLGDYVYNEVAWQVTDTFSLLGDFNYSFDSDELERWNVGGVMDHTPRLSSYVMYREIERVDSALVRYGVEYLLSPKYHLGLSQSYDVERNRPRNITVTVTRRMPRWLLIVAFDHDSIGDVTSAGIALAPEGFSGPGRPERNPFLMGGLESQVQR